MKDYEQYKRLIKCLSSSIIVLFEIGIYALVWDYYNDIIIEFPFFRKGNWLMVCLYGFLLIFFLKTYGGFKIGYLKKGNVIYSQVLSLMLINIITYLQIALIDKKFHPGTPFICMSLVQALFVTIWAFSFDWIYSRLFPKKTMLLIYGDRSAFHLMDKMNAREDKYSISASIHIEEGIDKIIQVVRGYDAVIIADIPSHERNQLLKFCYDLSIRAYAIPKISDILIRSSSELNLFDSPLYLSRSEDLLIEQAMIKRTLDIVLSIVGLLITSPFFLFIAMLLKLTDHGPVFYKQERLTKDGKVFIIYKFRTMIQEAERQGARLAAVNDERILPVGHLLRRLRLDELPQLINILKGDMSFVGPRPERPELASKIEEEIPEFRLRLKVKAGLTGYAQVYGKYNTSAYDKLKLDLTYIRNYSLWMDWKIMLITPKIMFMKESTEGVQVSRSTKERNMPDIK